MPTSDDQAIILRADAFAAGAHAGVGQVQRYTGQPYIVHAREVASIVQLVSQDAITVAAALLHDVIEDTGVTVNDLRCEFGDEVVQLVVEVTSVSCLSDGPRSARKAIDREHISQASSRGMTVKLADIIVNIRDIAARDPSFARIYVPEKRALLGVLSKGDATLFQWHCG